MQPIGQRLVRWHVDFGGPGSDARVFVGVIVHILGRIVALERPLHQCRKVVGFDRFWIARTDGELLSQEEIDDFEEAVEYDLRFDYGEEELSFWSDSYVHDGMLQFTLQDVYDTDDDDDKDEDGAQSIATGLDDAST